jgi:hypothetical protein
MDYAKEIAELETRREKLEEQLSIKGISEQKEHVIRQQIIAIDNLITAMYGQLPPPVPPPDSRTMWRRAIDAMVTEPVQVGAPAITWFFASWYAAAYFYTPVRHTYAPYTPGQMGRRERIFPRVFEGSTVPAAATKTIALSAFFLALRGWTNNPQALRNVPRPRPKPSVKERETMDK